MDRKGILHFFTRLAAFVSLLFLILPSLMFLKGAIELAKVKSIMLWSTVLWFIFSVLWLWRKQDSDPDS